MRGILNGENAAQPPEDVAGALRRAAGDLLSHALAPDGRVEYAALDYAAFSSLARLVGGLRSFSPECLPSGNERAAFWINLYNVLMLHGVVAYGVRTSVREVRGFDFRAAYDVGGLRFSLHDIYHGVLRANRPSRRLSRRPFHVRDRRRSHVLRPCDPRIHFALTYGAASCPPLRVYSPDALDEQLDLAARSFVNAQCHLARDTNSITTPPMFRRFRADFGRSRVDVIRFVLVYLDDPDDRAFLRKNLLITRLVHRRR
jgi:hypothetical protein